MGVIVSALASFFLVLALEMCGMDAIPAIIFGVIGGFTVGLIADPL